MRGTPRFAQRGPDLQADSSGQTTTEYALLLAMFVGFMLYLHNAVKDVVLRWFAEFVQQLSCPGV